MGKSATKNGSNFGPRERSYRRPYSSQLVFFFYIYVVGKFHDATSRSQGEIGRQDTPALTTFSSIRIHFTALPPSTSSIPIHQPRRERTNSRTHIHSAWKSTITQHQPINQASKQKKHTA